MGSRPSSFASTVPMTARLRVPSGPQLFDTGFRALFRYAGKQSTGGLGIEQQREGRCSRRQSKVPNGSLQPQVLRLERALDSGAGGLDGPFQEGDGGQRDTDLDVGVPDHFEQMAQKTEAADVGAGMGRLTKKAVCVAC